jgi:EmrB/QacA subfamily drug resistance transporter
MTTIVGTERLGRRAGPATGLGTRSPWIALIALCLGQSIVLIDTTIVNTAIPAMAGSLNASLDQLLWVINGYILAYAVLLVTAGRLGDLYGPKTLFLAGLGLFTVASAACGLAGEPSHLIAARVAQGVGAALLTPQSLSMITQMFPADRRGAALGIWGAVAGLAGAVGPTAGGFLIAYLDWRWVFFVNLPIGVIAFVFSGAVLPDLRDGRRHRQDLVGAALLTFGLFLLAYALIEGQPYGWGAVAGPVTIPRLFLAGLLVLSVFVIVERVRQDREPLLPFTILRDRNFTLMSAVVATLPCGLGGMLLLTMIYLQSALGLTALAAGLTVAVAPLVSVFFAPSSGRLTDRFGGKYVLVVGLLLFATGIAGLAVVARPEAQWWHLLPGLIIVGVAMGVVFSPAYKIAVQNINPAELGAASGVFNTTRLAGSLLGSAAVGAFLQIRLAGSIGEAARMIAPTLPPALRESFVADLTATGGGDLAAGHIDAAATAAEGLSPALAATLQNAADAALREGLANAVQVTYLFPVVILVVGAVATLATRRD